MVPLLFGISLTGILTSLMPTYPTFIIGRILNAFVMIAIFECYFTYLLEFAGGRWGTVVGVGVEYIWVAGWLLLAGLAWWVRDWRRSVIKNLH